MTAEEAGYRSIHQMYDVVVVGGGPMGLMTAYECAKAGKRVVVYEKSVFFNQGGSSADLVRMFRTAYTEGFMMDLAIQAMSLWDDLEKRVGQLRLMTGLLNFGDPAYSDGPEGNLLDPMKNLKERGMKYRQLTRDQIEAEHPFYNLPDNYEGLDMPDNGVIDVPHLTLSLYQLCLEHGVHLKQYAEVKCIEPKDGADDEQWNVVVALGQDKTTGFAPKLINVSAQKIAITCGASVNHILGPAFGFTLDLNIWEMVSMHFQMDMRVKFPKMWFQFALDTPSPEGPISNLIYGFPVVPWGPPNAARIAVDAPGRIIKDPIDRTPNMIPPDNLANVRKWVSEHIVGVGQDPVPVFTSECLQTNVYDNMFVLNHIPEHLLPENMKGRSKSIAVFTAGWGMKFVPLIGKVMKELLLDGKTTYDVSRFKLDRSGPGGHTVNRNPYVERTVIGHTAGISGSSLHR